MQSNERNFLTSYQNQYYLKNTDEVILKKNKCKLMKQLNYFLKKVYKKNFEIMPKYSLPKQVIIVLK